jgi:hypothetical protein
LPETTSERAEVVLPRKPWRHMHHDYQPIDEVRITTVPRYKTSGESRKAQENRFP